ncbi:MAG: zinc ribbon domain-containing protein [Clostridia bacterium]|nr:zinc ribbon domain-containing protein [Clostridia bacterium]
MAFLDDLQKTVTDAAYYTAKKTSELTGAARVKFNIKAEEIRLKSTYAKIGSLFYSAEREGLDHTDEIATLITQADKINGDIAAYREKLAELRKARTCTECGGKISRSASFCPNCGAKIVREKEENQSEDDYDPFFSDEDDDEDEEDEEK